VGRVRDEHGLARIAAVLQAGPDEHHAGQLAMGAGRGLDGEGRQPGDLAQVLFDSLMTSRQP